MKVKVFDESHEKDLEDEINIFLQNIETLIDIKFQVSTLYDQKTQEQIYCYCAIIIYDD